jgi:ATPase related to the helicase subunit of the Holliday junction resolvase
VAKPLADRIRPQSLSHVVGQHHLLDDGKALRRIIESGETPNMIFYGPSGTGKTTVANIIAEKTGKRLYRLNATTASVSDIRDITKELGTFMSMNGVLLYLDEIQNFNKKQQQSLLEFIENGQITLIASTTENPYFYIYNAVLSRSTVFEFKTLEKEDIQIAIERAFAILQEEDGIICKIESGVLPYMAASCGGDVRKAINTAELCALSAEKQGDKRLITLEMAHELSQKSAMRYDKEGDEHYDIVSAYQKSMRGSDADAAIHYLARLLVAGDLPSACHRLMVCASEDVGLAYPQIIPIVKAAVDAAMMLGLPEARIPLANAVILVANSPKSNTAYNAINAAMDDLLKGNSGPIPRTLQNKHFDGEDNQNKGQFYQYPHDFPRHFVDQQYLPDVLKKTKYYISGDNKMEENSKRYIDWVKGSETDNE